MVPEPWPTGPHGHPPISVALCCRRRTCRTCRGRGFGGFFCVFQGCHGVPESVEAITFRTFVVWGFWKTWEMGRVTPQSTRIWSIIHEFHGLPSTGFVWYIKFISTSIGNGPAWELRATVATRDPRDPRACSSIEKIRPYESIWVFVSGLQPHFLTFTNHFRFFPGLFPPKKISKNPPIQIPSPPSDRRISQHSPAAQSTETEASHRNPTRCWRRRGSADTRWRSTYHSLELPFKSLNSAWKMLSSMLKHVHLRGGRKKRKMKRCTFPKGTKAERSSYSTFPEKRLWNSFLIFVSSWFYDVLCKKSSLPIECPLGSACWSSISHGLDFLPRWALSQGCTESRGRPCFLSSAR